MILGYLDFLDTIREIRQHPKRALNANREDYYNNISFMTTCRRSFSGDISSEDVDESVGKSLIALLPNDDRMRYLDNHPERNFEEISTQDINICRYFTDALSSKLVPTCI